MFSLMANGGNAAYTGLKPKEFQNDVVAQGIDMSAKISIALMLS